MKLKIELAHVCVHPDVAFLLHSLILEFVFVYHIYSMKGRECEKPAVLLNVQDCTVGSVETPECYTLRLRVGTFMYAKCFRVLYIESRGILVMAIPYIDTMTQRTHIT